MRNARCRTASSSSDTTSPEFERATSFANILLHVQRVQVEALLEWQRSIVRLNQELWDAWVCRWAGGAPIDA